MAENVRFVRKGGKIIPIKDSKQSERNRLKNKGTRILMKKQKINKSLKKRNKKMTRFQTVGAGVGGGLGSLASSLLAKGKHSALLISLGVLAGVASGAAASGEFGNIRKASSKKRELEKKRKANLKERTSV